VHHTLYRGRERGWALPVGSDMQKHFERLKQATLKYLVVTGGSVI